MVLKPAPRSCYRIAPLLALLVSFAPATSFGQTAPTVSLDAAALVRRAVQHRLDAAKNHHPLRYVLHRVDERHNTTKVIVETADGGVARLIAMNGKALPADLDKAELQRLDDLAEHPELQEHRRKSEQKDSDRVTHLLSLLPDAFLYRYEGMTACQSGQCYRLSFVPNPHFSPPDLESRILRGVAGEVWVDQAQERLTRLDARFIADVDVGFGILGRLNKGGTVFLEQTNIGAGDWELTGLKIRVNGKILMVRSFSYQIDEETSHFSPVAPGLKYRDAIQLLKKVDPSETPYTP
ncbi:MAG TPA: hypothetical protein VGN01_15840 [Acidobacteriaceae bacterium]